MEIFLPLLTLTITWFFTSSNPIEQVRNTTDVTIKNQLKSKSLNSIIVGISNSKVELVSQNWPSLYSLNINSQFNHTTISAAFKKCCVQNKKLITEYFTSILNFDKINFTETQLPLNNNFK